MGGFEKFIGQTEVGRVALHLRRLSARKSLMSQTCAVLASSSHASWMVHSPLGFTFF